MKWHRSLTVQSHDSRMVTMIHVLVNTYLKFSSQWAGYGTAQLTGALRISIYCAWTRSNWPICEYINEEQIIICQFDWKTKTLLNSDGLAGWAIQNVCCFNKDGRALQNIFDRQLMMELLALTFNKSSSFFFVIIVVFVFSFRFVVFCCFFYSIEMSRFTKLQNWFEIKRRRKK